jgi:radical SAM superfamily enzyme YgiQ (UPF0313 family)
MNILLVYPKCPNTFWSFKHVLNYISKKAVFPPLGLLTVASLLPREWKKKLVDMNTKELKNEDILWADMVFIGAMLVQSNSSQMIINRCKAFGKTVVAGGPAFTTQYEKFKGVDHFVLNEAEVTLPLFLKDLEKGKLKKVYASKQWPDITKSPIPLWSLINLKDYATMAVQYSRGCPFNCEFCDVIIMNGRIPRIKTPEQIMNEIQSLYNAGWRESIFIVDDNFIGNKVSVKRMLSLLIKWQKKHKYPFAFYTEASLNLAEDKELMKMMSDANFYKVFLGIESPNIDSLKECKKLQNTTRDLAESVRTIHRNGMQVMGGFIVGFDNDPKNIFETQIKFIQQVGIATAMVGLLNALPKTKLWHRLQKEGRLLKTPSGENTDGSINFIPKMGMEELLKGYGQILSSIYSPKKYYKRVDTFIKDYNPVFRKRVSLDLIIAFFKSVWKIGILSNTRYLYWKLLIKTSLTKRKALPTAIELAIYRLHFEKVSKKVLNDFANI